MEKENIPLVGRFAPTPSGRMHLGNVFAALLAWLSVRSRDGEMVLRMEDLDTQRTSAEFARVLREDLTWLGLTWDRETPAQSTRNQVYDDFFHRLAERDCCIPATAPAVSCTASTRPIFLTVLISTPAHAGI